MKSASKWVHWFGLSVIGILSLTPSTANAQAVQLTLQCNEYGSEFGAACVRELSAIGITALLSDQPSNASMPNATIRCDSPGPLQLRFETAERTETQNISAGVDTTVLALRISERIHIWLQVQALSRTEAEPDVSEEPPSPEVPSPADTEPTPEPAENPADDANEDAAEAAAENEPEPTDNEATTDDTATPQGPEPVEAALEDAPPASAPSFGIGADLAGASFFGSGVSAAAWGLAGNLYVDLPIPLRIRVGAAAQLAGGGIETDIELLETTLLRLGGDIGYRIPVALASLGLSSGLGLVAFRVQVTGTPGMPGVTARDDARWIGMPYSYFRASLNMHPSFRVFAEGRAGYALSQVIALTFFGESPILTGHARFEAMVGAEARWGI